MAVTNSTSIYSPNSNYPYTLTAYFNENSTSTTNNTSNITVTATLSAQNIAFEESNAGTLAIYWHDNKDNTDVLKNSATIISCGMYPYSSQSVTSTFDTPHNNDGTLSGYAYAVWTLNKNKGGFVPNSGSVATANTALTSIPRAATITASEATIGGALPITLSNVVSSFTYVINATKNATTIAVGNYYFNQNGTMSIYPILNNNYYSLLGATDKYANVTLSLATYNNGTLIGTNSTSVKINANPNDLPTITVSSVDTGKAVNGTNRTTLDLTGSNKRIINQWNAISTTWSATTGYNTNIASVSINGATVSTSPSTLNDISNSLSITATNGRGYSKTVTENDLTFISYETPSIVPTLKRNTATDGHANLTFTGMFYNVNFGAESNTLTLEWYVREKGDTTYTQGNTALTYTINANNKTYKESTTISLVNPLDQVDGLFDYQKAYEFKFIATDKITSYTISEVLLTKGIPNLVVFKDAVIANDVRIDNRYSNSEIKIGRWVNNKPVYRSTFSYSVPSGSISHKNTGITTVDEIVNLSVYYYLSSDKYWRSITSYFHNDTGDITFGSASGGTIVTSKMVIIVEYTKTTDS